MQLRPELIQDFVADRGVQSVAELFHENSKVIRYDAGWGSDNSEQALQGLYRQAKSPFKTYRGHDAEALPRRLHLGAIPKCLRRRRSIRDFTGQAVTKQQLSRWLQCACGVTGAHDLGEGHVMLRRAAPSGGSLSPLELYVIVHACADLSEGIYHYSPREHRLERLKQGNYTEDVFRIALKQPPLLTAAVTVVMTAISARSMFKYSERAYRYILLEAGHVAQNMYLVAPYAGLAGFTIGGFIDDDINTLLGIDGVNEYAVYLFVAGIPVKPPLSTQLRRAMAVALAESKRLYRRRMAAAGAPRFMGWLQPPRTAGVAAGPTDTRIEGRPTEPARNSNPSSTG